MSVLLTFGDGKYEHALKRIEREAAQSRFFQRISAKRPSDLGKAFWRKHGKFVAANRRGYGYWLWKPWLVRQELGACGAGEMLVYADAGCSINGMARKRFDEYRSLLVEAPLGVLSFRLPVEERRYTKGDLFEALDAWHLKDSPQVLSSVILWRRCAGSMELATEWLARAETYHLITDAPSIAPNASDFVQHRHDQSLFSLLSKLAGAAVIDDETFFADWKHAGEYPFLARRLKGRREGKALSFLKRELGVRWQRVRHIL